MSNPFCHAGGMKIKRTYRIPLHALIFQPTTIARFGPARLVWHFDGPYELIGGTADDRAAAREWCSLFAPEIVFASENPQRNMQPKCWRWIAGRHWLVPHNRISGILADRQQCMS